MTDQRFVSTQCRQPTSGRSAVLVVGVVASLSHAAVHKEVCGKAGEGCDISLSDHESLLLREGVIRGLVERMVVSWLVAQPLKGRIDRCRIDIFGTGE